MKHTCAFRARSMNPNDLLAKLKMCDRNIFTAVPSEYKLRLSLEDGSVRRVDREPHWDGEPFEPLKHMNYFKTVQVNFDMDTSV